MRNRRGFTLVEVILSMTLLGITVGVASVLMGRGLDSYVLVNARTEALETARYALARMQREMTKVEEVNNAQSDRFGFQDYLGSDTDFSWDGTTLFRGADPLARNVSSLVFTYYRDNGAETNAPPQVRRIHVEMQVLSDDGTPPVSLRTDVFPRTFLYENFQ